MRIIAAIMMLLIMIGLLINTGRQSFFWLKLILRNVSLLVYGINFGLIVFAILAVFVASRVPGLGNLRSLFLVGHYVLGFLVYLVLIVNFVSLLLFLGRLVRLIPSPMPHSAGMIVGAVALILVAGLTIYGSVHSGNIQIKRYTVQIGQEQEGQDSLRIALISDIHLGYVNGENHVRKIVAALNAINPDMICIAGDIFDGDITALENPEKLQDLLREIDAPYGVYASLGNHDAGAGYEQMLEFLAGADVQVLMDEAAVIDDRFVLAGRRDSSPIGGQGDARGALKGLPEVKGLPVIVLDHQPTNIGEYGSEVDLIFSGHTHKGQMFPFNLMTNAFSEVDYGYYRASDTAPQVIVTSGVGTWGPPQRVATDNEVVEINVRYS